MPSSCTRTRDSRSSGLSLGRLTAQAAVQAHAATMSKSLIAAAAANPGRVPSLLFVVMGKG